MAPQRALSAAPVVDLQPTGNLVLGYPADRGVSSATKFVGESFIAIAAGLVARNSRAGHML